MKCEKCNSNMRVEVVATGVNHTSILRKLGRFYLILMTCGIWLLVPKRKENFKYKKICICDNCGYTKKN